MLRFALLWHDCPADYRDGPHWDLMLERADRKAEHRLATWSLLTLPTAWAERLGVPGEAGGSTVEATLLADHRVAYLDYEGPVSGDRGSVRRDDGGPLAWLESGDNLCRATLMDPATLAGEIELERQPHGAWRLGVSLSEATAPR